MSPREDEGWDASEWQYQLYASTPWQEGYMIAHSQKRAVGTAIILCALCLVLSGCGTICNVSSGRRASIYGGVRKNVECIRDGTRWLIPSDIMPLGGGAQGVICLGHWIGGGVDMPLSLVGDTLTLPYVLFRQQYRTAAERRWHRANTVRITHRATDGPHVEFATVVESPERFRNRVLRSTVNARADGFILPDGRIRLDLLAPLDTARHTTYIRFWCPGEPAEKNIFPCVVLQKHRQDPREKYPNSFEGDWNIYGTLRPEKFKADEYRPSDAVFRFQQKPDAYRPTDWAYGLTIKADGTQLVGTMTRGQVKGTIQGRIQDDGTFRGTCRVVGERNTLNTTFHLSPYHDIADGVGIPAVAPHQTDYYSIHMVRQ